MKGTGKWIFLEKLSFLNTASGNLHTDLSFFAYTDKEDNMRKEEAS